MPGLVVEKAWRPLDRVGLYVPGGATPLFSTLLMLALPARAAGVREIVVVTPPSATGLDPAIALAAELCGIDHIWTVGGAQAIAALAFGAGDIPACPKICGPGNAWVAEAKTQASALSGRPGDRHAGRPVRTDGHRRLAARRRRRSRPICSARPSMTRRRRCCWSPTARISLQRSPTSWHDSLPTLPRADLARRSLEHGRAILVRDLGEAAAGRQRLCTRAPLPRGRRSRAAGRAPSTTPARSSPVTPRRRASATISPAPATSCPPTARRGPGAESPCTAS